MVKRILKIVAIVLAGFIVVVGAFIGISALRGRFNEEVINISRLYFDNDSTITKKQIKTLDDVVANINFEPANATNREVKVEILGNENGIIKNMPVKNDPNNPKTLTAGEDFTLEINKDDKGNNIGGVVTIKVSQGIATAELKVVVDVNVPDNSLFFTGNNSGKITTAGKSFVMPVSNFQQYVYLNSNLINAFYLQSGNQNLKSTYFEYTYYREDGSEYVSPTQITDGIKLITNEYNQEKNAYVPYYKIPLVTDEPGYVVIKAKMHRTHEIEEAFVSSGFSDIEDIVKNRNNSNADMERAVLMLGKYNKFINEYISYFDSSDESYSFFKNTMDTSGKIILGFTQVSKSLDYVFVSSEATINVTGISLKDFASTLEEPKIYNVFDDQMYSISGNYSTKISDAFGLEITTTNIDGLQEAPGTQQEIDYMFSSLSVKPYLYLALATIDATKIDTQENTLEWANRKYNCIPVYHIEQSGDVCTPIITPIEDHTQEIGYLIQLTDKDEYLNVSTVNSNGEKHWRITSNVPLPEDQSSDVYKALFLGFEVSGLDESSKEIVKTAFTRVYVNYRDYNFVSDEINNLTLHELDPYMSINTSDIQINAGSSYEGKLTAGRYQQNIAVNLEDYVDNYETASYQNIMYFVEQKSNTVDANTMKVVTAGTYKFVNYTNVNSTSTESASYKFNGEDLVGERIPTYKTRTDKDGKLVKDYYLHALNASTEPVKIFAVVYLSDKSGKPIDVNGRSIVIDETNPGEEIPSLVVLRISEITDKEMPKTMIESYVDTINFYTKNVVKTTIGDVEFEEGFINRNSINFYATDEGNVDEDTLKEIQQFLRLKLLKDNYFTVYISNLELDKDGMVVQEDNKTHETTVPLIVTNEGLGVNKIKTYTINTLSNKQLAFNRLCRDKDNYKLYVGSAQVATYGNPVVIGDNEKDEWNENSNARMIRWYIHSSADSNSHSNPVIYLDPTESTIPYSTALIPSSNSGTLSHQIQKNNYTLFDTNKLIVEDCEVESERKEDQSPVSVQSKTFNILARYAEANGENRGVLDFKEMTASGTGTRDYTLPYDVNSIAYSVKTNITNNESNVNLDYVDCSQAIYTENDEDLMFDDYFYTNLYEYEYFYTKNVNNTSLTYTSPDGMMSFDEDFSFTNVNSEGEYTDTIYFGAKTFIIEDKDTTDPYININGFKLDVVHTQVEENNLYSLNISKGEYFPMINGDKALIYNELFNIHYVDDVNKTSYYIVSYTDGDITGPKVAVLKSASLILSNGKTISYNSNNYIDDFSNESKNTAIKVLDNSNASINFIQGEELGVFVQDSNGNYKKVVEGNDISYVLIENGESVNEINRYRVESLKRDGEKVGVKVFLLVTLPFMNGEKYFYRTIQYEVLQEDIDAVLYNGSEPDNLGNNHTENSGQNPLYINAGGQGTTIYLGQGTSNSGPYIDIKATQDNIGDFFGHIEFNVSSTEVSGISCVKSGSEKIIIKVPDLTEDIGFSITMSYPYKGKIVEKEFVIHANANVVFKHDPNKVTISDITSDTKAYVISLNPDEYVVLDTLKDYFEVDASESYGIKDIQLVGSNVEVKDNKYQFKVDQSYASYDDGKINYESLIYTIKLLLKNEKTIELNYKLKVVINPTNVVDISELNKGTITLFNGDGLYYNHIGLFNGNINVSDAIKDNRLELNDINYGSVFTISADASTLELLDPSTIGEYSNGNKYILDGIIKLKTVPTVDTPLTLNVSYPGLSSPIEFKVVIRGINMQYRAQGDGQFGVDQDDNALSVELKSNVTINVNAETQIDINNYLEFELSNTEATDFVIVPVLIDGEGNMITTFTANETKTYNIGYMKMLSGTGNGGELVEITGYTFTINVNPVQQD